MWDRFKRWLSRPTLIDQFFDSIYPREDVLELTLDMRYGVDPFGRFKRKRDATR